MAKPVCCVAGLGYRDYDTERGILARARVELRLLDCETEDDLIAEARDADALLVRHIEITERVLGALDRLQIVARYGIGYDNVDLAAATKHGVIVTYLPSYGEWEVSEHAMALMLALVRDLGGRDRTMRAGGWDLSWRAPLGRFEGSTVGIIGLGRIGRLVAKKLRGFDVKLLATDPYIDASVFDEYGAEAAPFEKLLGESDYVTLHTPLTDETRHMMDAAALALMKPTACLVNTSRGGVIDTDALAAALRDGRLRGAGIDVFETEPPGLDNPLMALDNVILTDHTAWYSEQSLETLQRLAAEAVAAVFEGRWPADCINPEVRKKHADLAD